MQQNEFIKDGFLSLRNAIVEQAAKDYLDAKKHILRYGEVATRNSREADTVHTLTKWFKGDDYRRLELKTAGDWMIAQLDILAKEELGIKD